MLIKCPECELQVSDKAVICPHCGYPIRSSPVPRNRNSKKRRLPNGFGQISRITNRNLQKPFRAMVSVGKKENGRPIVKPLTPESYFKTYNDAYAALVEYHKNPYILEKGITIQELYNRWSEQFYKTIQEGAVRQYKLAWRLCSQIHDLKVSELKIPHIKACMKNEENPVVPRTQARIKTLFSKMLDYAIEYDIVDRNVARSFNIDKETSKLINTTEKGHMVFTEEELNILWSNLDLANVDMVLVQCYSGWRPSELCQLKISDVDQENWTFTGGMKTDAGKNRTVPIHSRILPLVKARINNARDEYLFPFIMGNSKAMSERYRKFSREFANILQVLKLNPEHTPHDCRKTFVSLAKKYDVDEYAIKYLVGHVIKDLTENTYTERDPEWLKNEIEKIKVSE